MDRRTERDVDIFLRRERGRTVRAFAVGGSLAVALGIGMVVVSFRAPPRSRGDGLLGGGLATVAVGLGALGRAWRVSRGDAAAADEPEAITVDAPREAGPLLLAVGKTGEGELGAAPNLTLHEHGIAFRPLFRSRRFVPWSAVRRVRRRRWLWMIELGYRVELAPSGAIDLWTGGEHGLQEMAVTLIVDRAGLRWRGDEAVRAA